MKTKKIAAVLLTCIVAIGLMAGCGAYREPVQQTGRRQREADLQDHEERRETESGDCPE